MAGFGGPRGCPGASALSTPERGHPSGTAPGTIDSDYRGEVHVILINHSDETYTVQPGDRIAQLVIAPVQQVAFESAELADSDRGEGGFGSTGR